MAQETPASDLMGLMLKRWWVLVLGVLLGAGLAVLALRVVTPIYTATATQLIKGVPGAGTGANYLAAQFAVARAKSYPSFIYSSAVLDNVRSDLGPEFTDARLREQLSASNPIDTPLVNITATGSTPEEAQELANSASRHLARFITEIETVSGSTPVIVETAVQAGLPAAPSAPQPALFIALGVTGGFALGVIVILAWGALEARGRGKRAEAAEPLSGGSEADAEGSLQVEAARSLEAEGERSLRLEPDNPVDAQAPRESDPDESGAQDTTAGSMHQPQSAVTDAGETDTPVPGLDAGDARDALGQPQNEPALTARDGDPLSSRKS